MLYSALLPTLSLSLSLSLCVCIPTNAVCANLETGTEKNYASNQHFNTRRALQHYLCDLWTVLSLFLGKWGVVFVLKVFHIHMRLHVPGTRVFLLRSQSNNPNNETCLVNCAVSHAHTCAPCVHTSSLIFGRTRIQVHVCTSHTHSSAASSLTATHKVFEACTTCMGGDRKTPFGEVRTLLIVR